MAPMTVSMTLGLGNAQTKGAAQMAVCFCLTGQNVSGIQRPHRNAPQQFGVNN
jgi:hypothetical protein